MNSGQTQPLSVVVGEGVMDGAPTTDGDRGRGGTSAVETTSLVERLAETEAALHQARADLEAAQEIMAELEKLALVGRLASGMVHQLRNPVAAIRVSNEVLVGFLDPPNGEAVPLAMIRELSGIMSDATDHCLQVLDRLHLYTRDQSTQRTETDIRSLIRETVEFVDHEAVRAGATVTCSFADRLPALSLVPNRIRQVLANVILNAFQALPPRKGRLEITAEPASHDGVPHLRIRFRDNGCGFDRPGGQAGLGLSVSRNIVRQHGGHILVDTASGQGATVDVLLPVEVPAPIAPPDPGPTQLTARPAEFTARSGSLPPG